MTDFEYKQNIYDIVYLCSCFLNGTAPDTERVVDFDLDYLYEAAKKHMLASMMGQILQKEGVITPAFKTAVSKAQRKTVIFLDDLNNIISALETAGIWYVLLHTIIIRNATINLSQISTGGEAIT